MPARSSKKRGLSDRQIAVRQGTNARPAIGLEAEFALLLDGEPAKPEEVFGSPTRIVREPMMHRTGRSHHLPTGGAIYFDTGVIEVATPIIELGPGCAARAGRSLWESIDFLRAELDAWQEGHGHEVRLAGFSTHYNISFEIPKAEQGAHRTVGKLALLLTYILPAPVMILAANRESTGVGVRPRQNRIEITADFTPDAPLLIAAATVIVAVVREVMTWPSYELDVLDRVGFPVLRDLTPVAHSSRKGWVANCGCFPQNPFAADIDEAMWETRGGRRLSMREIARRTVHAFSASLRYYADPLSRVLIDAVMTRRARSLLDLAKRPESYFDVGNSCGWDDLYTERTLSRSRYERVLLRAIARRPLVLGGEAYVPTGVRGWSHVVVRRGRDGERRVVSLDELLDGQLR